MPAAYSSSDVAELTGLTVRALYHYEEIGLLPAPERNWDNHRVYTNAHILHAIRIKRLAALGLSLDEVAIVLDQPSSREAKQLLRRHNQELDADIRALRERRRQVKTLLESVVSVDILPDFADVFSLIADHGASEANLELLKAVIDFVDVVGSDSDTQEMTESLKASETVRPNFEDVVLTLGPNSSEADIADVADQWADYLIGIYQVSPEYRAHMNSPAAQAAGQVVQEQLNAQQLEARRRARARLMEYIKENADRWPADPGA